MSKAEIKKNFTINFIHKLSKNNFKIIFIILFALCPLELFCVFFSSMFLKESLGFIRYFFHPSLLLFIMLLIHNLKNYKKYKQNVFYKIEYIGACLLAVGYTYAGVVNSSDYIFLVSAVVFGPIFFILLTNFLIENNNMNTFLPIIMASYAFSSILFLILYLNYFSSEFSIQDIGTTVLTKKYKLYKDGFTSFMGNLNKYSNFLTLSTLICLYLSLKKNYKFLFMLIPILLLNIVLLSRASIIISLIGSIFIILYYYQKEKNNNVNRIYIICGIFLFSILPFCNKKIYDYFINSLTLDERYQIWAEFLQNIYSRFFDAPTIYKGILSLFYSFGIGNYSRLLNKLPEGGTHNIFLDAFSEAGLIGLIGMILLFSSLFKWKYYALLIKKKISIKTFLGLVLLTSVLILGLREYNLVYNKSQTMGTMFVAIAIALIYIGEERNDPKVEKIKRTRINVRNLFKIISVRFKILTSKIHMCWGKMKNFYST